MIDKSVLAKLPNGGELWIEATKVGNTGVLTESDISSVTDDRELFSLDGLRATIGGLATVLKEAIDDAKPSSATVEFGIEVGIESGKLTALWVKGTGKANVKVTLNWKE